MAARCRSLVEVLAQVEDPRHRRGRRHPLAAILAMAVAATLCGAKSYAALAHWGRHHGADLARALGFTRSQTPCAATLHFDFRHLKRPAFEAALTAWASEVLAALPPPRGTLEALAIDGKTVRGAQQQGACDVHLLSVLSHRLGLPLAQRTVPDQSNELTVLRSVLADLILTGRVVTVDAMLCQRQIARTIRDKGGTI
jgi:hypothetical protein